MAGLLATGLSQYIKRWLKPLSTRANLESWPRRFVIAAMVVAPSIVCVILVLGLRVLFASFNLHTGVIDRALDLVTVLVVVRSVVHALSISLGPNSWIRTWELRLTFVIWAIISFQLLGWFDAVER